MVYSQLFVSDEDQQAVLKRAQHEQAMTNLRHQMNASLSQRGSLGGASSATNQLVLQSQAAAGGLCQAGLTGAGTGLMTSPFGSQLGAQLGGQLSSHLGTQLGNQLGGNFGAQLGTPLPNQIGSQFAGQLGNHQLTNQLGGQLGAPSLLDVQRAENILAAAAMASSNSPLNSSVSQLAMMNAANPQTAFLQSRLGGAASLLGSNTQLPLSHDSSLFSKSHAFSLATANGGMGSGVLGSLEQELQGRFKRRRSSGLESDLPLKKAGNVGAVSDLKLPGSLTTVEDAQQKGSTQHQIQHLMKMREENTPKSRRKAKTFPVKLMQALMENPNEDAVAWLPDGKSFVIVNPDIFVETVLKRVFKECKYASFVRKLHRWGFVRLTSGTGTDCFHHPLFQQNRMDMCAKIICTPRDSSKASEAEKRAVAAQQQASTDKPPSLAGVEKFFRTRALTSQPAAEAGKGKDDEEKTPEKSKIDVVAEVATAALSTKSEEV